MSSLLLLGGGGGGTYVPPSAPDAPVLTADPGDGIIQLSWTAPANDGGAPITDYRVEWAPTGGFAIVEAVGNSGTYTVTGLTNGVPVLCRVAAINIAGTGTYAELTSTPSTPNSLPPVPVPNMDTTGAVTVGFSDNLQTLVNANPANTVFYFPNGTYTNVYNVNPKDGQRFIGQSEAGVILQGNSGRNHAFLAGGDSVVIARMSMQNYGGTTTSQDHAVIQGHGTATYPTYIFWPPSAPDAKDWHIHEVTMRLSANVGIIPTHRWKITDCSFYELNPHAIGGGGGTQLLVQGCYFYRNGSRGNTGIGVNNAQIKITWHNIGPNGDSSKDMSPHGGTMSEPIGTSKFYGNTMDCGNIVRALWFDLDVRDTEVAWNTFNDTSTFGVFYEGCNGGWVHHNDFNDCGQWWGVSGSAYHSGGAFVTGSSSNILVEDNTFTNCNAVYFFLGERGRNGGDWVTGYPIANDGRLINSFAPINPGDRSSVGSSNNTLRNNTFVGTRYVGYLIDTGINFNSEANPSTHSFSGNTYDGTQTSGSNFIWGTSLQAYSTWQAAGRQ